MQIELRETIEQAIRDREERNERMLQGTIRVEDEILSVIKARYEKERDAALEAADAKKKALQKEKALISEQLSLRKKLSDEEDKRKNLVELENKLALISADPTRAKEALELQKDIADLRDEIAWDTAENEAKAQQDAIDEQIEDVDDFVDSVKKYYEKLFKNQQSLIAEMKNIIKLSDEEIMAWLAANSEEYKYATEATQQDMRGSWQSMLSDMRGFTKTYWDEVERIIAQGDEAIIEFLKNNSAEYQKAGQLQAGAFVDAWRSQLENLRNAAKEVADEIEQYNYQITQKLSAGGSSGGSGSGSGGSGQTEGARVYYTIVKSGLTYGSQKYSNYSEASAVLKQLKDDAAEKYKQGKITASAWGAWNTASVRVNRYANGGLVNNTGLAWLDGTATKPERVLSPTQTKLFEEMVSSLQEMKRIGVSSPILAGIDRQSVAGGYTVGDVIVNVEKLETDEDYEKIGRRVMESIMRPLNRSSAIGGIRSRKGI